MEKIRETNENNCSSSNYSTCSENPPITHSAIIARNEKKLEFENTNETISVSIPSIDFSNERNTSVNILDKNIDFIDLTKDNDMYEDCVDKLILHPSNDSSTKYLELAQLSEACEENKFYKEFIKLNRGKNHDSIKSVEPVNTKVNLPISTEHNGTDLFSKESVNRYKKDLLPNAANTIEKCSKTCNKRVIFANNDISVSNKTKDWLSMKKSQQLLKTPVTKKVKYNDDQDRYCKNIRKHNTTESFVSWEKFCESEESYIEKTSSNPELSSISADSMFEDTQTIQPADETYLSKFNDDSVTFKKKILKQRSKSCDSLLREVKHLSHFIWDRMLKTAAHEINNIRKESIKCSCLKENRINNKNRAAIQKKDTVQHMKNQINKNNNIEDNSMLLKLTSSVSPSKCSTQLNPLPRVLVEKPQDNMISLTAKSPMKSPTTPKKHGYNPWQKDIVSPVGEYIRGRRPSPFKVNSPRK